MVKATRARTAETPKQPGLLLTLRAPNFYPDHTRCPIGTVINCPLTLTKLKSIFLVRMACFGFDRGRAIRLLRSRIRSCSPRTQPAVSTVRPICFRLDPEQRSGYG